MKLEEDKDSLKAHTNSSHRKAMLDTGSPRKVENMFDLFNKVSISK